MLHVLPYKGSRFLRCSPLLLSSAATALPLVPVPLLGESVLALTHLIQAMTGRFILSMHSRPVALSSIIPIPRALHTFFGLNLPYRSSTTFDQWGY